MALSVNLKSFRQVATARTSRRSCVSVQAYKVEIRNLPEFKGKPAVFEASPNQALLFSAEAAGINIDHMCRAGSCATCVSKLISGSVEMGPQYFLDEEQLHSGLVLMCLATPKSDLVLEKTEV